MSTAEDVNSSSPFFDQVNTNISEEPINHTSVGQRSLRYIFAFCLMPISLAGVIGNALVIIVTYREKRLRTVTHVLAAVLSATDLVICGIMLPVGILGLLNAGVSPNLCFYTSFLSPILTVFSTEIQWIISYVRYRQITSMGQPGESFIKKIQALVVICVVLNIILYISFVLPSGETKYDPSVAICSRKRPVFPGQPIAFVVFFYMGFCGTIFLYTKILLYVINNSFSKTQSAHQRTRITFVMFWLFIAWTVGYTFVIIIRFGDKRRNWPEYLYQLAYFGLWCNSCANPILYKAMCEEFSDAFKSLFRKATVYVNRKQGSNSGPLLTPTQEADKQDNEGRIEINVYN